VEDIHLNVFWAVSLWNNSRFQPQELSISSPLLLSTMRIPSIFAFAFVARIVVATKVAQLPLDLECRIAHDGRKRVAAIGASITAASLAY